VVDEGRNVLSSKVFLIEIPVLSRVDIERQVSVREATSPIIAKPHVVAQVGHNERRSHIGVVRHILHHVAIERVHEQDHRLLIICGGKLLCNFTGDSAESEYVPVLSYEQFLLIYKSLLMTQDFHGLERVRATQSRD